MTGSPCISFTPSITAATGFWLLTTGLTRGWQRGRDFDVYPGGVTVADLEEDKGLAAAWLDPRFRSNGARRAWLGQLATAADETAAVKQLAEALCANPDMKAEATRCARRSE
jgi:hypothetical protein